MQEKLELILQKIKDAEMVLVGIGERFALAEAAGDMVNAYKGLAGALAGKNYFIITTCVDGLIYEAGLKEERIVRPLAEEEQEAADGEAKGAAVHSSHWETYMKWLQGTLHKKLFVLELGVGLKYPNIIRFPFEKTVYFNQKAELVRVHDTLFQLPAELNGRGISVPEDPVKLFAACEFEKDI